MASTCSPSVLETVSLLCKIVFLKRTLSLSLSLFYHVIFITFCSDAPRTAAPKQVTLVQLSSNQKRVNYLLFFLKFFFSLLSFSLLAFASLAALVNFFDSF